MAHYSVLQFKRIIENHHESAKKEGSDPAFIVEYLTMLAVGYMSRVEYQSEPFEDLSFILSLLYDPSSPEFVLLMVMEYVTLILE